MDLENVDKVGSLEACKERKAREVFLRIQHALLFSQNPSFSDDQISYLEDLLANNLLSIVVYSRDGRQCSECFSVIDRVLGHIRSLRIDERH